MINAMEEPTVKDLRDELVKLGMPQEDADKLQTKAQLQAVINTLKASKVITTTEKVDPKEERQDEKRWQTKADRMAENLESQEKVSIIIPLDPNEKPGVVNTVEVRGHKEYVYVSGGVWSKTFNGYRVIVPKGVYTEVPRQIAQNIADENNQTLMAGEQWKLDRIDPNTGRPVREQL